MLVPHLPPRIERLGLAAMAGGVNGVRGRDVLTGAVNGYGNWVYIGTASFDWSGFTVDLQFASSRSLLFDVALGRGDGTATAAELDAAVIVDDFPYQAQQNGAPFIRLPLGVRAGQGVYIRAASTSVSQLLYAGLRGRGATPGTVQLGARIEPIGAVTNPTTYGTGPVLADGTWRAIGTAARDYIGLFPAVSQGGMTAGRNGAYVTFSFALGDATGPLPAAAPVALETNLVGYNTATTLTVPTPDLVERHCRAGTVIWARGDWQVPSGSALPNPNNATFLFQAMGLVP